MARRYNKALVYYMDGKVEEADAEMNAKIAKIRNETLRTAKEGKEPVVAQQLHAIWCREYAAELNSPRLKQFWTEEAEHAERNITDIKAARAEGRPWP